MQAYLSNPRRGTLSKTMDYERGKVGIALVQGRGDKLRQENKCLEC